MVRLLALIALLLSACAAPPAPPAAPPPTPPSTTGSLVQSSPAAAASPTAAPKPSAAPPASPSALPASPSALAASPSALAAPTPRSSTTPGSSTTPAGNAGAAQPLPTVERSQAGGAAGFLTAVELDLEFAQPIATAAELQKVVDGVLELNGVASAHSDGLHLNVRYDSQLVLPARIRDRLRELGHPATSGTEVQNPGDAAD